MGTYFCIELYEGKRLEQHLPDGRLAGAGNRDEAGDVSFVLCKDVDNVRLVVVLDSMEYDSYIFLLHDDTVFNLQR